MTSSEDFSLRRLRGVGVVRGGRADGGSCSRPRKPKKRGGAEPQRKYRSDPGKKQACGYHAGGHSGCSSYEASYVGAELFRDGLGLAFGARQENDGFLRHTPLPQLLDGFLRMIPGSEYSDRSFHTPSCRQL